MRPRNTQQWLWHADKLFMGAVLAVCTVAVVSFWNDAPRRTETPAPVVRGGLAPGPVFPRPPEPVRPDPSVDIATDPDEYQPRAGEHVCVSLTCAYILPDRLVWCPVCRARQDDRDGDGMDDKWEEAHLATNPDVADGDLDYDGDRFTNKEEFDGGSNPDDPDSIPAPIRLVGVGQEMVDALFRGFYERPGGELVIQLNWGKDTQTSMLELGSTFRGYKLKRVRERLVTVGGRHGIPAYTKTEYDLILERPGGGELVLPRNTPVREPERYGIFATTGTPRRKMRAYAGMTLEVEGHSYIVVEVSPRSAHLIGDRGEHYNLQLRPE